MTKRDCAAINVDAVVRHPGLRHEVKHDRGEGFIYLIEIDVAGLHPRSGEATSDRIGRRR